MDDKIYWMYGFWIVLSGAKSAQAIGRLIGFHRLQVSAPADRVLLTVFWTVAFLFYGYVCLRHWRARTVRKVT